MAPARRDRQNRARGGRRARLEGAPLPRRRSRARRRRPVARSRAHSPRGASPRGAPRRVPGGRFRAVLSVRRFRRGAPGRPAERRALRPIVRKRDSRLPARHWTPNDSARHAPRAASPALRGARRTGAGERQRHLREGERDRQQDRPREAPAEAQQTPPKSDAAKLRPSVRRKRPSRRTRRARGA
jgi:hypothetical protein